MRSHLASRDCFVWVALKDPEPAELATLQEEFGLHELAIEDAQKGHQRPKIDEYGSSLFIVLHLDRAVRRRPPDRRGRDLRRPAVHRVGAARRAARIRRRAPPLRAGAGAAAARARLRALRADGHRRRSLLSRCSISLTAEIEEIEERIFAGQTTRAQIEALYSLKRKLMTLDHATQPLLEVAGKLHGGRVPPICAGLHDYFRDVYDHLLRLEAVDRQPARHGGDRDLGQPVADHASRRTKSPSAWRPTPRSSRCRRWSPASTA